MLLQCFKYFNETDSIDLFQKFKLMSIVSRLDLMQLFLSRFLSPTTEKITYIVQASGDFNKLCIDPFITKINIVRSLRNLFFF